MRRFILALSIVLVMGPGAFAHRLVEDDGSHTGLNYLLLGLSRLANLIVGIFS